MFCNYAGVEHCTQPLDWHHQHQISMPVLADSTPPNRLPAAFHRMKSFLDATDRRVVDLRPSVAPVPEPPYGCSNFGGPEAAQRRQNIQPQTWSSRPYRDAEAYNQSRYNRSTVNHYSGWCTPPQNSFQPHGQQHQPSCWDYQTAQTGYLQNCPPPYVAANPWQPPALESSDLARTKDTERDPSIPMLEEVQSLPTEAILDRLLATLAVFETRLETMDRRLDNLQPLAQSKPDPPYVLRGYGLTELDPHRTAAANTLGPQPYSGYSVEMNGKSGISNIALLAKICEDQSVDQSGITGDDVAKNMDEEKDTVGLFSIEREDTTMGEMELGSTHEEEMTIDFAVEVKPKEEICDDAEYPGHEEVVVWPVDVIEVLPHNRMIKGNRWLDNDGVGQVPLEDLDISMAKRNLPRRYVEGFFKQKGTRLFSKSSGLNKLLYLIVFDPGGESSPKLMFASLFGVSWFPP